MDPRAATDLAAAVVDAFRDLLAHDELIPSVEDRVTVVHLGGLVERKYLTVRYLVGLMRDTEVSVWEPGVRPAEPVTYVGLHRPEGLPEGATVITLETLNRLVPA